MESTCTGAAEYGAIIYYSHLVPISISLLIGVFALFRSKFSMLSRVFAVFTLFFCLWLAQDIIVWIAQDFDLITFTWASMDYVNIIFTLLAVYFFSILVFGKDLENKWKILLFIVSLPAWWATISYQSVISFDQVNCEAINNAVLSNYKFAVEILAILYVAVLGIFKLLKHSVVKKKGIAIVSIALILFMGVFSITEYIASNTGYYELNLYGLFVLPLFLFLITYSTTNLSIFDFKQVGTQILSYVMVILVGSQFFFIEGTSNQILTTITFILALSFGVLLVRDSKREIEQRIKIEKLAKDLAITNDRLVDLNRQKSEFVSFATHQLRAPITAMRGYLSLIKEGDMGEVPEKIGNTLEVVSASVDNLAVVVDDYLNVSRIELRTMKFDFAKSNVSELLNSVIIEMKQSIEKAKLSLSVKVNDGQNYFANMDVDKIRQVFTNVIDNSIKYTKIGGIDISLENKDGKIYFTVKDTGLGISKEEMPKLFNKFTRANNASETNIKGTGLGLYIAKEILLAHHGKIWAESEGEGKGSQFVVEIPESK